MFQKNQVFPGICHITDAMGVSFTLVEGKERAVLFDTGYGTENVDGFISTLTGKPVKVYLSHGHHDHILGARWFGTTFLCAQDMDEFRLRTGTAQREAVAKQAREQGVELPDGFTDACIKLPEEIRFTGTVHGFECLDEDLGGRRIKILRVPGHTPGSIVIYVPEYGLLLTGDNWNPCTWMWFPTSEKAGRWRRNMLDLIAGLEEEKQITAVLCSHQPMMRTGEELKGFLEYMTDERISEAPYVDMGSPINTHRIVRNEWTLIFDADKA